MKIRSITTLLNPGWPLDNVLLEKAGRFIAAAKPAFEAAGYEVQTTRLVSVPFPRLIPGCDPFEVLSFAQTLENAAESQGYNYVSIGPALPEIPISYTILPEVFIATQNVFAAGIISSTSRGISLGAIQASAQVIRRCAGIDPDGFGNLYFTALANVPPGGPFLPAGYHVGGQPKFALATEAASLAVEAFRSAESLLEARQNLIGAIEKHAQKLSALASELSAQNGIAFGGIDFTLAPFPSENLSIGSALEALGVPALGLHGSLAASAFLVDTLDRASFPRAGFCGLMLPVLEDSILAARAAQGTLSVMDLLLYASVCGTGLDTVPLPGDVSSEQIAAILLDVAALAQRLNKPLTARLMPIPGKAAGEAIAFDFPYFADSRVLPVRAKPLTDLFSRGETFDLKPRP